jgi:hypothetical protein
MLWRIAVSRWALRPLHQRSGLSDTDKPLPCRHLHEWRLCPTRKTWLHQLFYSGGLPNTD